MGKRRYCEVCEKDLGNLDRHPDPGSIAHWDDIEEIYWCNACRGEIAKKKAEKEKNEALTEIAEMLSANQYPSKYHKIIDGIEAKFAQRKKHRFRIAAKYDLNNKEADLLIGMARMLLGKKESP